MVRQRFRIRFSKKGNLRFIGHIDLMRTLEMLFRRCRLPLAMSSGFHPKPRMSFPSALPLGYESEDEVLDLEFDESAADSELVRGVASPAQLAADLNAQSVEGLAFLSATKLADGERKVKLRSSVYQMSVINERDSVNHMIEHFLAATSFPVQKANGKTVDARSATAGLTYSTDTGDLFLELLTQDGPEAGVKEVLTALGLDRELFRSIFPKRIESRIE